MQDPVYDKGCRKPSERSTEADVTVQVELFLRIIPVSDLEQMLHEFTGNIFENRRTDHSGETLKKDISLKRCRRNKHDAYSASVDGKEGTFHETSVDEFSFSYRTIYGFPDEAYHGIDTEHKDPFRIQILTHFFSSYKYTA